MVSIELDGSIVFSIDFPKATTVELVGAFDGWAEQRHPMARGDDGLWTCQMSLGPGEHLFRYLVDGEIWALDTDAHGTRHSQDGIVKSRLWRPPLKLTPDGLAA